MGQKDDTSLPLVAPDHQSRVNEVSRSSRQNISQCLRLAVFLVLGRFIFTSYLQSGHRWRASLSAQQAAWTNSGALSKEFQQTWATYSPYFAAADYIPPPEDCRIIQVNLLQRHGARYPTAKNTRKIQKPLQKLVDAASYSDKAFEFLGDFEWDLGVADLLPLGEKEAFEAGSEHYLRYRHLITADDVPFVRASGSDRVVYSATNWTAGFASASGHVYSPKVAVIIPEGHGSNNTLDESTCPNFSSQHGQANTWRDVFAPPIADRLNRAAPGAGIDAKDVASLMPLCAFETIFHGTASPFCSIFTQEEFQAYEYYVDIKKFYKTGYGNALGPVHGVGYINELLARLTSRPVQDETQTNHTLDASPVTFPLNRTFYADFAHSNQMVAIYSALGLFPQDEPPNPLLPDPARTWRMSRMMPFSGRLITEKLWCEGGGRDGEYVRILANDAVQRLASCGGEENGLCEMSAFVESQGYGRSNGNGDWEKCFANVLDI
ncbi:histidine phosphatase superfamily [Phlebopus sp. FC_14]|nr:histidine phosphatase superfamily [Phlebopus sp. FC_14]